jgi:hypothetical protein
MDMTRTIPFLEKASPIPDKPPFSVKVLSSPKASFWAIRTFLVSTTVEIELGKYSTITEVLSNLVSRDTADGRLALLDDLTVLYVDSPDGTEGTSGGVVRGNELGDYGEWRVGVDSHSKGEDLN